MVTMAKPQSPYQAWGQALALALTDLKNRRGKVIVLFGPSDYLMMRALRIFKQNLSKWGHFFVEKRDHKFTAEDVESLWQDRDLFCDKPIYIVSEQDKSKDVFWPALAKAHLSSPLLVLVKKDTLNSKELGQLSYTAVPCFNPLAREVKALLLDLCQERSLKLAPDAQRFVEESLGENVVQLEHEVEKLSLIFAKDKDNILSKTQIAAHLSFLRDDQAFLISELLLEQKVGEAGLLLMDLEKKGQPPLAILGLLARFYRILIKAKSYQGDMRQLGKSLGLPSFVAERYLRVARGYSNFELTKRLMSCQRAERRLKSSFEASSEIILADLIFGPPLAPG